MTGKSRDPNQIYKTRFVAQGGDVAQVKAPPVILVGIAGGSGAGKSYVTERLLKLLGRGAVRLSLDDFYRDRSHLPLRQRERINFDHPRAIDWRAAELVLSRLRNSQPAHVPAYDFATHSPRPVGRWLKPGKFVLVEGLWALRHPAVRRLLHLKLYLDCPANLRLQRRLARDAAVRRRSASEVRRRFRETVAPMHSRFVAPQARYADIVLPAGRTESDLVRLALGIRELRRSLLQQHQQ